MVNVSNTAGTVNSDAKKALNPSRSVVLIKPHSFKKGYDWWRHYFNHLTWLQFFLVLPWGNLRIKNPTLKKLNYRSGKKMKTWSITSRCITPVPFKDCQMYWRGKSLQTRYKIKTRFSISGSRVIINFKLCQMYRHHKGTIQITLPWLSWDLVTICRPDTNWGPHLVSLVLQILMTSNLVTCAVMNNWWLMTSSWLSCELIH